MIIRWTDYDSDALKDKIVYGAHAFFNGENHSFGELIGNEFVFFNEDNTKQKIQVTSVYDEAVSPKLIQFIEASKIIVSIQNIDETVLVTILDSFVHPITKIKFYSVIQINNIYDFDLEKNFSLHWFRTRRAAHFFTIETESFIKEQKIFTSAELGREFGVERQNVAVSLIKNNPEFQPLYRSVRNTPFWDYTSYHSIMRSVNRRKNEGHE